MIRCIEMVYICFLTKQRIRQALSAALLCHPNSASTAACCFGVLALDPQAPVMTQTSMLPAHRVQIQ